MCPLWRTTAPRGIKIETATLLCQFNQPNGVAVDGDGNVIVADSANHHIRKITPQGHISTLVPRDGEGTVAQFDYPWALAVDGDSNVLVANRNNHRISKITPLGQESTLAGTGDQGYRDVDRVASAQFNYPGGVAVDANGNVIVGDMYKDCIRCVASDGAVTLLVSLNQLQVAAPTPVLLCI
jgi:DNA-binding beta-propeller fold protein YncE